MMGARIMMRDRLLHNGTRIIIALVLLLPGGLTAATGAHWTVVNQPTHLVNGTPVLFEVTTPTPVRALSGSWLGHEITFSFEGTDKLSDHKTSIDKSSTHEPSSHRSWFALAGVSLETKPGTYPLELHAETASSQASAEQTISFERKIRIEQQRYPRVELKVPTRYTAPSPEDQREIEKGKEIKAEVFETVSDAREWEGSFSAPVNAEISDLFGVERVFNGSVQSTHEGLDFRVPSGTTVEAVNSGRIILAQPLFFEGNCVVIDHGQGLLTLYLHLSKFLVKEGDDVTKGQPIGLSGGTGRATGPHLHLAVRWQGVYLNPQVLLKLKLP
jgi:murein DD-endopeptidase MepM/ murein hydrolase activator NlpD